MKTMKKFLAILLVVLLFTSVCSLTAWAGEVDPEPEEPAATTGSITVKNATKGYEYYAYKVFDATYDGDAVSYTTPAANAQYLDDTLFGWSSAADADGNISVWALQDAPEADILEWVEANYDNFGGTAISGVFDATNSTVTFSGLDFGYYYITSGLGAAVTIDSAVPDAEVYDKNEATPEDPAKTIVAVDGVAFDDVKEADAHVGSVVDFKVTAATTNWYKSSTVDENNQEVLSAYADTLRTEWKLIDTATNMSIDPQSIHVKVNGAEITNFTAAGDANGGMILTIPMVDSNGNSIYPSNQGDAAGQIPIEITYSATILAAAASAPAKNEIPGDHVTVYTYAFQVAKTDGTDPLPGAQFELWSNKGAVDDPETTGVDESAPAALTFIDNGDGTYTYSVDGTVTTLDMTTNTTIVIKGLDNGWNYTLKETKVPAGYNQAEDVSIAGSSLTKVEEIETTNNEVTTTTVVDTSITSTALYKETVVNNKGVELPSTGGIGTTIFYIVGSLLVVGAGVLLVTKKRVGKDA